MNPDRIFKLFACCLPVKGARRSLLCDVQRQTLHFIPNDLYEVLTAHRDRPLGEIKAHYGPESEEALEGYFRFLLEGEYGFWCDDPSLFPDLDLTWERPEAVTNALIDVDDGSAHDFAALLGQLDDLGCKALQLRFFRPCGLDELDAILGHAGHGRLRSVELLLPYGDALTPEALSALCAAHQRISHVFVYGAPDDVTRTVEGFGTPLHYRRDVVDGAACCGAVHTDYFVADLELFTEAQAYNTCLNRKIAVDARGEIKNCPSMARSFGNARDTSLHGALAQQGFKDLWSVNKDQIEVCKDCEFRYVCTDCRAYLDGPAARYAKPAKCTYDPYTAQWL